MKPKFPSLLTLCVLTTAGALSTIQPAQAHNHEDESHTKRDRFPIIVADVEERAAKRFAKLDEDGNGSVSSTEFEQAKGGSDDARPHRKRMHRKKHGRHHHKGERREALRTDMQAELFTILDDDQNGTLDAAEFGSRTHADVRLAHKRARFKHLDRNGDGSLQPDELGSRLARLRQADLDGNGEVTRDEMRTARQARRSG